MPAWPAVVHRKLSTLQQSIVVAGAARPQLTRFHPVSYIPELIAMDDDGGGMVLNLEMPYEPKVRVWAAACRGMGMQCCLPGDPAHQLRRAPAPCRCRSPREGSMAAAAADEAVALGLAEGLRPPGGPGAHHHRLGAEGPGRVSGR